MSVATDRIAFYWLGKGDANFLTAGADFTEEDTPLLDAGVFQLANEEQETILCPFGCGDIEPIHILPRYDGKGNGHYVVCSHGLGEMEIQPRDYQLYAFNSSALLRYNNGLNTLARKRRLRKRIHPQGTNWIMIERKAVLEYANDPKRNKSGKMPHELCDHVWNLNKSEFEAAAFLPGDQRGYKNVASLRAYFYRCQTNELKRKALQQAN